MLWVTIFRGDGGRLTFDMSGGCKRAKHAGRRPLDGRVRRRIHLDSLGLNREELQAIVVEIEDRHGSDIRAEIIVRWLRHSDAALFELFVQSIDARDIEVNQSTDLTVSGVFCEEDFHSFAFNRRKNGEARLEPVRPLLTEAEGFVEGLAASVRRNTKRWYDSLHDNSPCDA